MSKKYRAGVIGRTGRGNYGHGLDRVYLEMEEVEIVAVADDNPDGLIEGGKRLGVSKLYADYREMLKKEKFDIVSVAPRWVAPHRDMVLAVAVAKLVTLILAAQDAQHRIGVTVKDQGLLVKFEWIHGYLSKGTRRVVPQQEREAQERKFGFSVHPNDDHKRWSSSPECLGKVSGNSASFDRNPCRGDRLMNITIVDCPVDIFK